MKIDGQCHCGQIAYEAELDPGKVGICHCTDCQTLSASAFRTVALVAGDAFRITQGTPRTYVKEAESGNRRVQAFCPNCGSALYATDDSSQPAAYSVRVGTMLQRRDLAPQFEIWRQSAMPWYPEDSSTEKFDKAPK